MEGLCLECIASSAIWLRCHSGAISGLHSQGGLTQHSTAQHSTAQHGTARQHGTAAWHSTAQQSIARRSTAQPSPTRPSPAVLGNERQALRGTSRHVLDCKGLCVSHLANNLNTTAQHQALQCTALFGLPAPIALRMVSMQQALLIEARRR